MPDALPGIFARARDRAGQAGTGETVAFVTPEGMVGEIPVEPPPQWLFDRVLGDLPWVRAGQAVGIATIADASLASQDSSAASRQVPFLALLMMLRHAGHRVWIFDGSARMLAAGIEHAHVLIIDSAQLPKLPADWMAVAQRVMPPPRRVLLHKRENLLLCRRDVPPPRNPGLLSHEHENLSLALLAPSADTGGWVYGLPADESSYLICLLTVLARTGLGASVELVADQPVPELAGLTTDPGQREWIVKLPFDYTALDARKAIEIMKRQRGFPQRLSRNWTMRTGDTDRKPFSDPLPKFAVRLKGTRRKRVLSIQAVR